MSVRVQQEAGMKSKQNGPLCGTDSHWSQLVELLHIALPEGAGHKVCDADCQTDVLPHEVLQSPQHILQNTSQSQAGVKRCTHSALHKYQSSPT